MCFFAYVYVTIHYVAQDSFVLQIDDFVVNANILGFDDLTNFGFDYEITNNTIKLRADVPLRSISIYNMLGQSVSDITLSNIQEIVAIDILPTGVYIAQATHKEFVNPLKS